MIILFYKRLKEPGGAERLLINQYNEMRKLGIEVKVMSREISDHPFFQDICTEDLLILGKNPLIAIICFYYWLFFFKDLKLICSSGHIDIFFYSLFGMKQYFLKVHHPAFMSFNDFDKYCFFYKKKFDHFAKSNFGAKAFYDIKSELSLFKKLAINCKGILSLLAMKRAKKIFVLSELAKKEKELFFGVKSFVEKGAINKKLLSFTPKEIQKYSEFDYKFFTLARLDKNKRIDELLKAFKLFLDNEPNSVLMIGGQGDEMKNLIALAKELNIQEQVIFLGFIDDNDIYSYYSLADIFISIDWADFRITAYEALAMGTKVILSNETDKDSFLENSGYLKLVKPIPIDTCNAMQEMLHSKTSITSKSLNQYLENFTWENYIKRILFHLEQQA